MEALDRARTVNARLALPRLERMLRVYRTWVNVEGVEGGMALTRRELQYTEDDIVEAELALVISTCCNGLYKLGLIEEGDSLSELDAMAVAYEAFDFVELEDGDKMTFTMFLKWMRWKSAQRERVHVVAGPIVGKISAMLEILTSKTARRHEDADEQV
eukprot:jgi/Phyca11/14770/fgenesh1_pg.PHYCAscaffold_9_\